jgi:flagellar export protein FliJ
MAPRFNLQNVLDIRHSRVEGLELELSSLLVIQLNLENKLASLIDYRANLMQRLANAQQGEIDLAAIHLVRTNIQQFDQMKKEIEIKLKHARFAVEGKRLELVKAKQDEETLEILKRKKIEEYNLEAAEKEARAQDDIYISLAFRQRISEAPG